MVPAGCVAQTISPTVRNLGAKEFAVITAKSNWSYIADHGSPAPEFNDETNRLEARIREQLRIEGSKGTTDWYLLELIQMSKFTIIHDLVAGHIEALSSAADLAAPPPTVVRGPSCLALLHKSLETSKFQGFTVDDPSYPNCLDVPATATVKEVEAAVTGYLGSSIDE
jgi:hypothetical protein